MEENKQQNMGRSSQLPADAQISPQGNTLQKGVHIHYSTYPWTPWFDPHFTKEETETKRNEVTWLPWDQVLSLKEAEMWKRQPLSPVEAPRLMGKHNPSPGASRMGETEVQLLGAPTTVEPELGEGSQGRLPGRGWGQDQGLQPE